MRTKKSTTKSTDTLQLTLDCMIADAIDQGLMQVLSEMTPRHYVDARTRSSFELGLKFKQLLRDEMYERRREAMVRQETGWPGRLAGE
ncbi:hypothetical protein [Burkholderia vietnamiensis]|uniref:hypothetical protein n=1 Tax=Burkholderia vietnamiensis TaxID=60552 RepID=UPI001CF37EC7|nr:hypothetical protein [Burkholderia vietnamiensis]MCA8287295.1 hypothetical protein [Burkholderia vietnamiensis]